MLNAVYQSVSTAFFNRLFNDAVSTTQESSVGEIGDSEVVFGEYLTFALQLGNLEINGLCNL